MCTFYELCGCLHPVLIKIKISISWHCPFNTTYTPHYSTICSFWIELSTILYLFQPVSNILEIQRIFV
jgi:hypothetical protein